MMEMKTPEPLTDEELNLCYLGHDNLVKRCPTCRGFTVLEGCSWYHGEMLVRGSHCLNCNYRYIKCTDGCTKIYTGNGGSNAWATDV